MKTELVDVSETRKNLVVEIPTDKVDAEITRVTTRYSKQARLPGFRPGKVPAKVVLQRFKGQILQDAAEHLVGHAVQDALAEHGVQPVEQPSIQDLSVHEGQPLTFTATFDVVPTFDPGDLSEIELRKQPVVVDEEAVTQALERLRERAARFEPVDGDGRRGRAHRRGRPGAAGHRQGRQQGAGGQAPAGLHRDGRRRQPAGLR